MKCTFLHAAALAAGVMFAASSAKAINQLLYSFETGSATNPDSFEPNPFSFGPSVAQDTIGATDSTHSMKFSLLGGPTHFFEGALTTSVDPSKMLHPDALAITMDVTIPTQYAGTFANMGITYIGAGFVPVQMTQERTVTFTGTQTLTFPLISGGQPIQNFFAPTTGLALADFQIFINKDNTSGAPITVFIDNVRVVPEPATVCSGSAALVALALARRRRRLA